jgi:hypothetical protein
MLTLNLQKTAVVIAAFFAVAGAQAAAGNKADYDAAKQRIAEEFKSDKAACASFSGNKKEICLEQAKGKEKVSKAEAEYNYTGKASDSNKVMLAKADSDFAVAKEMCDDKGANDKDVCRAEAKAAHEKALADSKMSKKVGEARNDAMQDKRDADYKVATEKCDSLAGDAKAACVNAAKAKFNKS